MGALQTLHDHLYGTSTLKAIWFESWTLWSNVFTSSWFAPHVGPEVGYRTVTKPAAFE
jgi:hypothetical protein